jgi:hypothetical protein
MAISGDPCVSFSAAKAHLRVFGTDEDDAIAFYLETAQHLVTDRLERATTDTQVLAMIAAWNEETTPGAIKAAVLTQCAELYRFRGDDEVEIKAENGRLSDRVERYLGSWLERPFA